MGTEDQHTGTEGHFFVLQTLVQLFCKHFLHLQLKSSPAAGRTCASVASPTKRAFAHADILGRRPGKVLARQPRGAKIRKGQAPCGVQIRFATVVPCTLQDRMQHPARPYDFFPCHTEDQKANLRISTHACYIHHQRPTAIPQGMHCTTQVNNATFTHPHHTAGMQETPTTTTNFAQLESSTCIVDSR